MISQKRKSSKKVRTGDKVVVLSGNAKGQSGVVLACIEDKVLVQGVNIGSKHVKRSQQNPQGGKIEMERPIHVSNVCVCDDQGSPLKLKVRSNDSGEREFFYENKDGKPEVYRSIKRSQKK